MKIAHISIIPAFSPGIFKKLEDKAKIAKENNLNIDFYLINPSKDVSNENLHAIKIHYENIPTKFLKIFAFRVFKIRHIVKHVPLHDYDAIVLRYPLVDGFGTIQFAKKYGYKIFTEHHSDEISELFSIGRSIDIFRAYLEKYFSGAFFSNIKGIIGVTDEITKLELSKTRKKLFFTTIANGINPNSFSHTGFIPFDGEKLDLIFVASEFSPWHGVEKLFDLLKIYNGDVVISLKIIGSLSKQQQNTVHAINNRKINIEIIGKAYGGDLDNHMKNANLAISSLALSEKNMKEACTLKSREYIVRGIPFIYAYKDTDLVGDESFAKRFEEDNITLEAIIEFANFTTNNKSTVEEDMQKYTKIISWENKLRQLKNFIETSMGEVHK